MIQKRFNKMHNSLIRYFDRIYDDRDYIEKINSQLLNVLQNCDQITYNEIGTAEAYVLLHFLDRYHRFQITFDRLNELKIMPKRNHKINILDIGTGPGSSMYAISDFYTLSNNSVESFEIDYVEQSDEFRNWLHNFTELINFQNKDVLPWKVPYHHGSFFNFNDIDFNQIYNYQDLDDDGDLIYKRRIIKHRFDVIVMSNFLTTEEQTLKLKNQIKDCIRYLRNKGILIIVGAKGVSEKYTKVYSQLDSIILSENYNTYKFKASCKKLEIKNFSYSWSDEYGSKLKSLIRNYKNKTEEIGLEMLNEIKLIIESTITDSYDRNIEWEVHIYKKFAKIRNHKFIKSIKKYKNT